MSFSNNHWILGAHLGAWILGGIALGGCGGDSGVSTDSPDDSNTDMDDGTDTAVTEYFQHCPGVVDEKKDVYYCIIPAGDITADSIENENQLVWIPGLTYVLDGTVFIGDDVDETTLTIEPGALILGNPVTDLDNTAALIIRRNSKIEAEGTPDAPIVFSSANAIGSRANDDWGGIVINGNAPVNICGSAPCEASGEGGTGTYGGEDEDDDSGTLAYVRIEFSGKRLTPTVEYNGLTLQGVGRGTDIHHIQIHRAGDDSIEFFGGTAEVHHVLLTGTGDDSFDWTNGWRGKAQFVICQHLQDIAGDCAIEADNFESNYDALPRSNPTLYNFTFQDRRLLLRRGTAGTFANLLIADETSCLDIADKATWDQIDADMLTLTHSAVRKAGCFMDDDLEGLGRLESDWWASSEGNRVIEDFELEDMSSETSPSFLPRAGSPVLEGAAAPPDGDSFFEAVDFIGAMGEEDWTLGWTEFPEN